MPQLRVALRRLGLCDWILAGGFVLLVLGAGSVWFRHNDPAVAGMIDPYTPYLHPSGSYHVAGLDRPGGQLALLLGLVAVLVAANRVYGVVSLKPALSRLLPLGAAGLSFLCVLVQGIAGDSAAEVRAAGLFVAMLGALAMVVGAVLEPGALAAVRTFVGKPSAAGAAGIDAGTAPHILPGSPVAASSGYGPAPHYDGRPLGAPQTLSPQSPVAPAGSPYDPVRAAPAPAAPAASYCPRCGVAFAMADGRFCGGCGAPRPGA